MSVGTFGGVNVSAAPITPLSPTVRIEATAILFHDMFKLSFCVNESLLERSELEGEG
jgi:hypothetical protein